MPSNSTCILKAEVITILFHAIEQLSIVKDSLGELCIDPNLEFLRRALDFLLICALKNLLLLIKKSINGFEVCV